MASTHLHLIDADALRGDLAALTASPAGDGSSAAVRAQVLAIIKARIQQGRAEADARLGRMATAAPAPPCCRI
jgi:hypothetical protein